MENRPYKISWMFVKTLVNKGAKIIVKPGKSAGLPQVSG